MILIWALCPVPGWSQVSRPQTVETRTWLNSYETIKQLTIGGSDTYQKCGFPAITIAIKNRKNLTPEISSALQILQDRPSTQKSIVAGRFCVHYDTSGFYAAAMLDSLYQKIPGSANQFADSVAAIANFCEDIETRILGYAPSPGDTLQGGGPQYDIYVTALGDYGFTTPESAILDKPDGGRWTSFITVDNAFQFVKPSANKGLPALRVTLAHELHHSIQIGNYGYWTSDIFFYEMTSVWMEDVLFTQVNDYYQYVNSDKGEFNSPQIPFFSDEFIMYSRAVWCHYIAKRFGRDAMLRTWEEIGTVPPLQAIDQALSKPPYASSFKIAFAEWNVWNYFTGARNDSIHYYPEGGAYRAIQPAVIDYSPPLQTETGVLHTLGSTYVTMKSGADESPLVLSNINLPSGESRKDTAFSYAFSVANSPTSDSYIHSNSGLYVTLNIPDPKSWYLTMLNSGPPSSSPFPDPFKPDGHIRLNIPVSSVTTLTGTLSVFTSAMELVYSSTLTSEYSALTRGQVFQWNGMTNKNSIASSGVYFYFLEYPGQAMKGKFAVLRK